MTQPTSPPPDGQVEERSDEAPDIVVYTLGWAGHSPAEPGERPNAQLHSRVVVNGEELRFVHAITVHASGNDFVAADLRVSPGSIRFVTLDRQAFDQPTLP